MTEYCRKSVRQWFVHVTSDQNEVAIPSPMDTVVRAWYRGSRERSRTQWVPWRSPLRVSILACCRTHCNQAEALEQYRRWMSFRSKHTLWVPKALMPSPPRSLVVHTFSHATRHFAAEACSPPAHRTPVYKLNGCWRDLQSRHNVHQLAVQDWVDQDNSTHGVQQRCLPRG
jgi:hypothetical protein